MNAVDQVVALVNDVRGQAAEARRLAGRLDNPKMPVRWAERAADAATQLERLAVDLERHFGLKREVSGR